MEKKWPPQHTSFQAAKLNISMKTTFFSIVMWLWWVGQLSAWAMVMYSIDTVLRMEVGKPATSPKICNFLLYTWIKVSLARIFTEKSHLPFVVEASLHFVREYPWPALFILYTMKWRCVQHKNIYIHNESSQSIEA